jgi:uncharacterized membrane protein YidH (DUF202 family)
LKKPSFLRILLGWLGAGGSIFAAAAFISPLAGAAFALLVLIGLTVAVGPSAHFILARRACERGDYKPIVLAMKVDAGMLGVVLVAATLGAFNFA